MTRDRLPRCAGASLKIIRGKKFGPPWTLDANGNVTETDVTDPKGFVRKVTFSAAHYPLTDKGAVGTSVEQDFSFSRDPNTNFLLSMTDPLGRQTSLTYDANGNVLTKTSHWARELIKLGHDARMMPPAYVKPYVRKQKNDAADAAGICEAVTRPSMRFVGGRTLENQAALMHYKAREMLVAQRTQLIDALHGHLAEIGVIVAQGLKNARELARGEHREFRPAGFGCGPTD